MLISSSKLNIDYLQTTKESQYFDRKSARKKPEEIARHIAAFANANGGVLVIGIEDNGDVTGFSIEGANSINDFLKVPYTHLKTLPKISHEIISTTVNGSIAEVLVFNIAPSTNTIIYTTDNKVYLRIGDSSKQLNHEQITHLEYDKGTRFFEDEEVFNSSIDDIDEELIESYKAILDTDKSAKEILDARGLLINGHLTNAGVLLFAKNPTKFLPNARLRFLKFDSTISGTGPRLNLVKEINFDEAIPKIIMKSREAIKLQLRDFQFLTKDGTFRIIPEYPEFAWFEGIVNALTHRDYSIRGDHVKIMMYDDRLEIKSPGSLPNIVTLENMKETRYSRNPRIARTLCEFGWVKELNEGVNRIYDEMQLFFLNKPVYSEPNKNSVQLVLENNIISRKLRTDNAIKNIFEQKSYNDLSTYEKIILSSAFNSKKLTTKEASEILNKSVNYTRNKLNGLVEKGFLEWHGSSKKDPTQYYTIKE